MKYIILLLFSLIAFKFSFAQIKKEIKQDTIPIIQLSEVTVSTVSKNQNQLLKDFFIANKNATTEDILSRLPEINMIRRGSYGTEPLIRSYNTGQINILIDGMRIYGACTDKMDPVSIYVEPQNLENIQVNTHHSSQYGSNVGGVVDMKLQEAQCTHNKQWTGSVSSGYQTAAKAFYESGVLQFSNDKWAIRTNITYRKASNYLSSNHTTIPYSSYEKLNYGLSAKYAVNKTLTFKTDFLFDDGWNIGYPALPMDVGYAAARIFSFSVLKDHLNSRFKNSDIKIYANRVYHLMDDTQRKNIYMHMDMPGLSKTIGSYFTTNFLINKVQHIQLRADFSSTDLMASMTMFPTGQTPMYMLTLPNNRNIQSGISITYKNKIDSANTLILSSRIDKFINSLTTQEAKNHIAVLQKPTEDINRVLKNISAEFNHQFSKQSKASIALAYAERNPTANEFYGYYLFNAFDNYDYLGNTTLLSEKAFKADVNFNFTLPKFRTSFNVYFSKIGNYIIGVYQPNYSAMTYQASGVKQYNNISYVMLAGAEVGLIYKPQKSVQIISTFKYNYGVDNANNSLPLIPPFKNISSVRKELNKFSFQAEVEIAATQNRVNKQTNEMPTNGFVIANTRASYTAEWNNNKYRIDAGIENLFDKAYTEHLDWNKINRPGRNFYLQFSYYF